MSNIEKAPHGRIASQVDRIVGATVFSVGLGISGLIFNAVDGPGNRSSEAAQLAQHQAEVDAAKATEERTYQRLGEACTTALKPYAFELGHTSETDAMNDLLTTSGQPCGEEPLDARKTVKAVRDNRANVNAQVAEKDDFIEAHEDDSKEAKIAVAIGTILSTGVGRGIMFMFNNLDYINKYSGLRRENKIIRQTNARRRLLS